VTRKTRLSALATAFGLTLTLGLALPISAERSNTFMHCTYNLDIDITVPGFDPWSKTWETDGDCWAGPASNVANYMQWINVDQPGVLHWQYSWGKDTAVNIAVGNTQKVTAWGKAQTGVYPFDWAPWSALWYWTMIC